MLAEHSHVQSCKSSCIPHRVACLNICSEIFGIFEHDITQCSKKNRCTGCSDMHMAQICRYRNPHKKITSTVTTMTRVCWRVCFTNSYASGGLSCIRFSPAEAKWLLVKDSPLIWQKTSRQRVPSLLQNAIPCGRGIKKWQPPSSWGRIHDLGRLQWVIHAQASVTSVSAVKCHSEYEKNTPCSQPECLHCTGGIKTCRCKKQ